MRWLASVAGKVRRSPPWVGDGVLAVVLLVLAATTVGEDADPLLLFIVFVLLQTLPIATRRYWPRAVLAITLAATIGTNILTDSPAVAAGVIVALYTVSAHCDRKTAVRAAWITGALLGPTLLFSPAGGGGLGYLVPVAALLAIAWVLGDNLRTRRAYLRELEDKSARLEREREENARRAAAEEQARIARELHDVIAHNVSVMVVQATAAGDVFDSQPAKAREALASIEHTGREALTELRRLLGAVRTDDGKIPQPGLGRLPKLLGQVRAAGLDVDLASVGDTRQLPLGIDVSAYRIVQEALTNTLKHANARHAQVVLRYSDEELAIDVTDDGRGPTNNRDDRGQGLIGMRERVALYDGDLTTGPRPGGGFAVSARFPLE
jgi:signal transduction histidine kinase